MLFINTYILQFCIEQNTKQSQIGNNPDIELKFYLKSNELNCEFDNDLNLFKEYDFSNLKRTKKTHYQSSNDYIYKFLRYSYKFQDQTYWNKNKNIKTRRLRYESEALRRVLYDIKPTFEKQTLKLQKR